LNLDKYQELTGITVPDDQQSLVEAQIRRTQRILESMLGFTLNPKKANQNFYNELGKSAVDCPCPNVDPDNLLDPDEIVNAYRLFPYDSRDEYLHIDPFSEVHAVKLVFNDITVKTFDNTREQFNFDGWGKYLQNCKSCVCKQDCYCVQLAVDADWLNPCKYSDIMDVWAEMVTYYADCKKDVKQESIGAHSYTKFDNTKPETEHQNILILKRYAGPNGTLSRKLVA